MPGISAVSAFVEGGHGWRNLDVGDLTEGVVGLLDFGEGGFFGFVSDSETGKIGKRW